MQPEYLEGWESWDVLCNILFCTIKHDKISVLYSLEFDVIKHMLYGTCYITLEDLLHTSICKVLDNICWNHVRKLEFMII